MANRRPPVTIGQIVLSPDRKDRVDRIPFPEPPDARAHVINLVWQRVLVMFSTSRGLYSLRHFCNESIKHTTDKSFFTKMAHEHFTRHQYPLTNEVMTRMLPETFMKRLKTVTSPWLVWDPTLEDDEDAQCFAPGPQDINSASWDNWDPLSVTICIRAELIDEYLNAVLRAKGAYQLPVGQEHDTEDTLLIQFRLMTAVIDAVAHLFQIFIHRRDGTARACTPDLLLPARALRTTPTAEQSKQPGDAGKWMQAQLFGGVVQWLSLDGEDDNPGKPKVPHMILDKPGTPEELMEVDIESIKKVIWSTQPSEWTDVRKYLITTLDAEENDAVYGDVVEDIAYL